MSRKNKVLVVDGAGSRHMFANAAEDHSFKTRYDVKTVKGYEKGLAELESNGPKYTFVLVDDPLPGGRSGTEFVDAAIGQYSKRIVLATHDTLRTIKGNHPHWPKHTVSLKRLPLYANDFSGLGAKK